MHSGHAAFSIASLAIGCRRSCGAKVKRGLVRGPGVQALQPRLVVDRENEIRAFVPAKYWSIEALLQTADGGKFSARYYGDAERQRPS